jgi:hypothetical protein
MSKSGHPALARATQNFEFQVRQFVIELAKRVIEAEFARVQAARRTVTSRPPRSVARTPGSGVAGSAPPAQTTTVKEGLRPAAEWTRDAVIAELGRWLVSSKDLEASHVKRHGPKGLVDAAKRIFGRFDAALNAANLAIARQMHDPRRVPATRKDWPSMRELARRQRERRSATPSTTTPE